MKKEINKDFVIGILILFVMAVVFLYDCINDNRFQFLGYDESYNATVAANVVRYGEYKVSYPDDIVFYNMITTGQTVLLPTAFFYKFFGINMITSSIVPVFYSVACIFALWMLLNISLKTKDRKYYTLSAILIIFLVLSDRYYGYISRCLLGEIAALFFIIMSLILLLYYFEKRTKYYIFLSGFMMACAFITKSSMIFFVVSFLGIILLETVFTKNIKYRDGLCCFFGFITGIMVLDFYKLFQLGGIEQYILWWKMEWNNMLNQSSGVDISYSILEKIEFLDDIFWGYNILYCLVLILSPIIVYTVLFFWKFIMKKTIDNKGIYIISIAGVGGASLLVFFILLGGSGLANARRLVVNVLIIKLFACYIIGMLVIIITEMKKFTIKSILLAFLTVFACILTYPYKEIKTNTLSYLKQEADYAYGTRLMKEFLREVGEIPDKATLYCAGWWQEPNVTLFLDRDMKDINDIIYGKEELSKDGYFIVGNLIHDIRKSDIQDAVNATLVRVDESNVDYEKYSTSFNRNDFDLYAIYKIELNEYPEYELGKTVYFTQDNDSGSPYIKSGLSIAENNFTWTSRNKAVFWFTLNEESELEKIYHLKIDVSGVFDGNQNVEIKINGNVCYEHELTEAEMIDLNFESEDRRVLVEIYLPDARSPEEMGTGVDSRKLGLMIRSLMID